MTGENTPELETDRLLLRRFRQEDAPALLELLRDEEVNTFLPWFPITTLAGAEQFLQERFLNWYERPSGYRYAICCREEDRPIGYVCLSQTNSCDLGYAIGRPFWHRGLVTEAATAVVERMKQAGYKYITATHDVNNPHSGAVMKKLGMIYRYSYVEQWQPKNIPVTFRMYQLNFDGNIDRTYRKYWDEYEQHFIEKLT